MNVVLLVILPALGLAGNPKLKVAEGSLFEVKVRFRPGIATKGTPSVLSEDAFRDRFLKRDYSAAIQLVGQALLASENKKLVCKYRDGFAFGILEVKQVKTNWWVGQAMATLAAMRTMCGLIHELRVEAARTVIEGRFDDYSDAFIAGIQGRDTRVVFFSNNVRQGTVTARDSADGKEIVLEYVGFKGCIAGSNKVFAVVKNDWATLLAVGANLAGVNADACPSENALGNHVYWSAQERNLSGNKRKRDQL